MGFDVRKHLTQPIRPELQQSSGQTADAGSEGYKSRSGFDVRDYLNKGGGNPSVTESRDSSLYTREPGRATGDKGSAYNAYLAQEAEKIPLYTEKTAAELEAPRQSYEKAKADSDAAKRYYRGLTERAAALDEHIRQYEAQRSVWQTMGTPEAIAETQKLQAMLDAAYQAADSIKAQTKGFEANDGSAHYGAGQILDDKALEQMRREAEAGVAENYAKQAYYYGAMIQREGVTPERVQKYDQLLAQAQKQAAGAQTEIRNSLRQYDPVGWMQEQGYQIAGLPGQGGTKTLTAQQAKQMAAEAAQRAANAGNEADRAREEAFAQGILDNLYLFSTPEELRAQRDALEAEIAQGDRTASNMAAERRTAQAAREATKAKKAELDKLNSALASQEAAQTIQATAGTETGKLIQETLRTVYDWKEGDHRRELQYRTGNFEDKALSEIKKALLADGVDQQAVENTVETLRREIHAEWQRQQAETLDEQMRRSGFGGWLTRWAYTLASVPMNLASPVGMLAPVATALNGSDYTTVDPNSAWFGPANAVNSIRETHQKYNAGGKVNDMLYGIITSSMDSVLGGMVGSGITSGLGLTGNAAAWVGGSVIGAEAAAQSMQDIAARGGSVDQVLTGGLMAGAFETIFEQFSLSQLQGLEQMDLGQAVLEAIGSGSGSLKTALREVTAKNVVKGMITNGSEELFTELANVLYDRFAMGDISNYGQMVRDYMSMGMTEEEARKKAAQQLANQVLEAGYTGALQGLLMDSVALAGNDTRRMSRFAGKYDSAVLLERAAQEAAAGKRMTNREAETILQDAGALRILTEVTGLDISENMSKSQQREAVRNAVEQLASSGMEAETEQTQNPAPAQEAAERPAARDTAAEQRATEEYMGAQKTDTTHSVLTETSPTSTAETADAHMSANDSIQQMPAGVNGVEQIRQAAERSMGKAGAAQAVAFYNGDMATDRYFGSFAAYYQAGVNGSGMDSVRPAYKGVLNQAQEQAAYLAGQTDAAESLEREKRAAKFAKVAGTDSGLVYDDYVADKVDAEDAERINSVAKSLGLRVRFVDSVRGGRANASINIDSSGSGGNEILIEKGNRNPVLFLLGHEIIHRMQQLAPEQYRAFRNFVAAEVQDAANVLLEQYRSEGEDIRYEGALDEAAANYAGRMLEDGQLLDNFIRRYSGERTLLEKLRDAFLALIEKLHGGERRQAQLAVDRLNRALDTAAAQAAENGTAQTTETAATEDGGARYSLKNEAQKTITQAYQKSVDDVMRGSYGKTESILMGYTPDIYQSLGMPSLPFVIGPGHVYSIAKTEAEAKAEGRYRNNTNYHGMGVQAVKDLYSKTFDPVMVIAAKDDPKDRSKTRSKHSVVAIVDVGSADKSLLLPIEITAERTVNGQQMDVNVLSSAYHKNAAELVREAIAQENIGQIGVYYAKKKAADLLVDRVQFPKRLTEATASNGIVHRIDENVNLKIMDQTQSLQFKRWFGDWQNDPEHASKVVDEDGKPLLMYHGTREENGDFTVFDYSKAVKKGGLGLKALGKGNYFTSKQLDGSERYGSRVISAYLDIKRPFEYTGGTSLAAQVQRETGIVTEGMNYDELQDAMRKHGYDGVIERGKDGKISIAVTFDSNQIKSTTDNIGTFDRSDPDIRHSLKGSENADSIAALRRQNEALRERVEYWKGQTRRTDRAAVDPQAVRRTARELARAYGARLSADEQAKVTGELQGLYDYITRGEDGGNELTYTEARRRAGEIADTLVNSAVALDDTLYKQYADLRDYARKTQIILSEADARSITDFGSWRKGQMGRMNLKTGEHGNVDTVYQEMAQTWPGLFPDGSYMHPADQLLQIAEVLDGIYTVTEYNPHSAYLEDAKAGLANEIMERFFEVPQVRKTFADRQAEALAAAKAEGQARLEALRAEKNERIAEIRQKNKENLERVVTRERRMREEQLQRLKDHYSKLHKDQVAHRVDSDDRNRLLAIARRLQNKKLPAASRALLDQYIGNLDTVARSITGRNLRDLRAMRDWYDDRTANDPDFIPDPSVEKALKRLSQRQINDLSAQEVAELTNVLLHIENELQTERKLIDKEDRRDTYFLGEEAIRDVYATRGSKGGFLDKYIVTATLSPVRQLRRLTGYVDSDPLYKLTQDLADGQRRMFDYQMRAERPAAKFAADKVFSKFFSGKDAKGIEISGLTKDGVKTVTISPAMRVSLYLHSLNNQNLRHIKEGGITIPDWELYRKGKIAEAYDRGVTLKLTPSYIRRIAEGMTAKERAFAHMAQRYFNGQSRDEINAVSEKLKGFSIAQVENYFPLDTDKSFTRSDFDSIKFDGSIEGMGFLKERKNAANPIMLRDANDVLQKSIRQHAKYVGLAIPVRNFNKVWGVTSSSFNEDGSRSSYESSVQQAIKRQWGEAGYSYIEKMMTDLQGGSDGKKSPWARTLNKIRSNYAGAVLTLNFSVAMKQAASYPTAAAVLGWKPLMRALRSFGKVNLETIEKYTPLQWYRSQGFSTKELGDLQAAAKSNAALLNWIRGKDLPAVLNWVQGMDVLTTRKLWKASEYYVRQNNKQLSVGSDAYYKAVAEIYNRVIEETQPNYTTMQRPQLLRSDDSLLGNVSMFKTQPFQNFNILYDAAKNLEAKGRQAKGGGPAEQAALKAARRDFARAVTSQLVQQAIFIAMTEAWALFRGRRKKYEDKDGNITFWSVMKVLGEDFAVGVLAGIPGGSEIFEVVTSAISGDKYYGVDALAVTAISDAFSGVIGLAGLVRDCREAVTEGEPINWNSTRVKLDKQLDNISKAVGVPYENVANLFNAVFRQTSIAVHGKYEGEYAAMKLTTDPEKYSKDYYDLLYKAMQNDQAAYEAIYADMLEDRYMGMSFTADKIKKAMEQRMKDAQGVESVKDLESRYLSPAQQTSYDAMLQNVQQSSVWGRATEAQRDSAEDLLYELASGSSTGQKLQEKIDGGEAYGIDEADYVLYKLALSIVDQPTESGKLGTYTNDEVEAAIGMLPGLSAAGRAYLWEAQGKSEKSNPYK